MALKVMPYYILPAMQNTIVFRHLLSHRQSAVSLWPSCFVFPAKLFLALFGMFWLPACSGSIIPPLPTPDAAQRAERIAQREIMPDTPVNRFGIVEGFWFPELVCELGVGWERIIFDWAQHQPENSESWNTLNVDDRWLAAANDCNREVVALLKHTPAWATDGIPNAGLPRGLYLPVDDPKNVWANFVRKTVSYYKGRMGRGVTHFIIWNEPDINRESYGYEFEGTLEDYAQMLKVAYLVAKEANPEAKIHLAGTTYWHDINVGRRPYIDRLIETIAQDPDAAENAYYFDAVSLHIYFRTDTVYDIVMQTRAILEKYGLTDKAIWINETNAAPTDDPQWQVERPQFPVDLEQQASFLVQAAALALAADVERVAVYKLYDQNLPPGGESFGIISPVDQQPRPAFFAWQMITQHFNAAVKASLVGVDPVPTTGYHLVNLEYPDKSRLLVAWARTADEVTIKVTSEAPSAALMDIYGTISTVYPDENNDYDLKLPGATCDEQEGCFIGGRPIMLHLPPGVVGIATNPPDARSIMLD